MGRRAQKPKAAIRKGANRWVFSDLYHQLLRISWPVFILVVVLGYVWINLLFGTAYYLAGGPRVILGLEGAGAWREFWGCYFFSVQTLATIGYGQLSPHGLMANFIVTIEALVGLMGLALSTGLLFARFSRPTARVRFSDKVVIVPMDGVNSLALRVANERASQIVEAQVSLTLIRTEQTKEGEQYRELYDLQLERSRSPFFIYSWTIIHPIGPESPLHGVTRAELEKGDVQLIASLGGIDELFSASVHARHLYLPKDFHWGRRFVDILSRTPDGRVQIELDRIHELRPEARA